VQGLLCRNRLTRKSREPRFIGPHSAPYLADITLVYTFVREIPIPFMTTLSSVAHGFPMCQARQYYTLET
jgi:hypothetical protein